MATTIQANASSLWCIASVAPVRRVCVPSWSCSTLAATPLVSCASSPAAKVRWGTAPPGTDRGAPFSRSRSSLALCWLAGAGLGWPRHREFRARHRSLQCTSHYHHDGTRPSSSSSPPRCTTSSPGRTRSFVRARVRLPDDGLELGHAQPSKFTLLPVQFRGHTEHTWASRRAGELAGQTHTIQTNTLAHVHTHMCSN